MAKVEQGLVSTEVRPLVATPLTRVLDLVPYVQRILDYWDIRKPKELTSVKLSPPRAYLLKYNPELGAEVSLRVSYSEFNRPVLFEVRQRNHYKKGPIYQVVLDAVSDDEAFEFEHTIFETPEGTRSSEARSYSHESTRASSEWREELKHQGFKHTSVLPEVINVEAAVQEFLELFKKQDFQAPELVEKK